MAKIKDNVKPKKLTYDYDYIFVIWLDLHTMLDWQKG